MSDATVHDSDAEHTVPMSTCKACGNDLAELAAANGLAPPPLPIPALKDFTTAGDQYPYDLIKSIKLSANTVRPSPRRRRSFANYWTRLSTFFLVAAACSALAARSWVADEDPEPFDVDDLGLE